MTDQTDDRPRPPLIGDVADADLEAADCCAAGMEALRAWGRLDKAIQAFQRALIIAPAHGPAVLGLAVAQRGRREFPLSIRLCRRSIVLQPDWADAHGHLARLQEAMDVREHLDERLRIALCCDPAAPSLWTQIGRYRCRRHQDPTALAALSRAVGLCPQAVHSRLEYCAFLMRTNRGNDAEAHLRIVLALEPSNANALVQHSQALSQCGLTMAANIAADRAVGVRPSDPAALGQRAFLAFRAGRFEQACVDADKVLAVPTDTDMRSHACWLVAESSARNNTGRWLLNESRSGRMVGVVVASGPGPEAKALLEQLQRDADERPFDPTLPLALAVLWRHLERIGWYRTHPDFPIPLTPAMCLRYMTDPSLSVSAAGSILVAMGYANTALRSWNATIFENIVLPALRHALEHRAFDWVILPMTYTQWSIFVQPHTQAQAESCYRSFEGMFRQAGLAFRERGTGDKTGDERRGRDGTVFLVGAIEANPPFHLDVALRSVFGQAVSARDRLGPLTLCSLGAVSERFRAEYRALGVEVLSAADRSLTPGAVPSSGGDDTLSRLISWLRWVRPKTVVFFNLLEGVADLLAAARVAPVQIYLSPDFHHVASPDIDGHITFGSAVKGVKWIMGRPWRCCPFPISDTRPHPGTAEAERLHSRARAIRMGKFGEFSCVLGTIGRPEKLSVPFLNAIKRILHDNPKACFLWFGSDEVNSIIEFMVEWGISDRCFFEGWVDTTLYAEVLDIHLDSFPFPSGLTMVNTMCASGAFVLMESYEAAQLSVGHYVKPLLDGAVGAENERRDAWAIFTAPDGDPSVPSLYPLARDEDDYVALTNRLITIPDYRKSVGMAGRRFLERFLFNAEMNAQALLSHVVEIADGQPEARYDVFG